MDPTLLQAVPTRNDTLNPKSWRSPGCGQVSVDIKLGWMAVVPLADGVCEETDNSHLSVETFPFQIHRNAARVEQSAAIRPFLESMWKLQSRGLQHDKISLVRQD